MENKIQIVLIKAGSNTDARKILEHTENAVYENTQAYVDEIVERYGECELHMYDITDFMDLLNNDEINIGNYFMGYIYLKN